jgi:hypothetical protein
LLLEKYIKSIHEFFGLHEVLT